MAVWVVGAPRIDKIEAPREQAGGSGGVEIETPLPGQDAVPQAEAADRLAAFWDRMYTEYNVAKALSPEPVDGLPGGSGGHGRNVDLAGAVGVRRGVGPIGDEKHVRSPESISCATPRPLSFG